MYQDIVLGTTADRLQWDMMYINTASAFSTAQFLAVHIRDTSDTILQTLFITNPGDPQSIPTMTPFSYDISAYAGTTIRLDIEMNVQNNWLDAAFDNFTLTATAAAAPPPPPAAPIPTMTVWGLGILTALLAIMGSARRRMK